MKFKIIDNKSFIILLNSSYIKYNDEVSKDTIKNIILLIKKRYSYNICGVYEVDVYKGKNLFLFLKFKKMDDGEYYLNTLDLKIKNHKEIIKVSIDDFDLLKCNNKYKICEHYSFDMLNLHK